MGEIKTSCCQPPPPPKKKEESSPLVIGITFSFAIYFTCKFIFPLNIFPSDQKEQTQTSEQSPDSSDCGECVQSQPIVVQKTVGLDEYTIQVCSFSNKKDAFWKSGRLRASRINNFVMRIEEEWLVCVGRYSTEQRAKRMVEVLKKHGIENPIVLSP